MTDARPGMLARLRASGVRTLAAIGSATDHVIGAVAPAMAARRAHARAAFRLLSGSGGYEGARRDRPATKNWNPRNAGPDSALIPDLPALRARSYDLDRNAPIARAITGTYKNKVVGASLWPRARLDHEFLGISEARASELQATIDRYFWSIADGPTLDFEGQLSWVTMCKLALGSWLTGGDMFVVRRYEERPGDVIGTRVQLLEADRVSNPDHRPATLECADGVERDARGRVVAIHVADVHPGETGMLSPGTWTRVPIYSDALHDRQVLHVFEPQRIGQSRGEPIFAPIIEVLKQLKRMSDAELQAAVLNSYYTVIVTTAMGDGQLGDLEQEGKPKPELRYPHAPMGSDITLGSGTVAYTAPGEKLEFVDPKRPNPNVDGFIRAFCGYAGAATGIPREVLLKEFTASYSAARAALIDMFSSALEKRGTLVDTFCQPIYEWVLGELVDRGILAMPGFHEDPIVRRAWCEAEWHGPTMPQIDPVDEIDAAAKRVALGVSTLEEECAQLTGGDWSMKLKQRVKEVRLMRAAGLDLEPIAERVQTETTLNDDGSDREAPVPPRRTLPPEPEGLGRLRGDARDAAERFARGGR